MIEPIVKDTAEELLREYYEFDTGGKDAFERMTDLIKRTRKLLESK